MSMAQSHENEMEVEADQMPLGWAALAPVWMAWLPVWMALSLDPEGVPLDFHHLDAHSVLMSWNLLALLE